MSEREPLPSLEALEDKIERAKSRQSPSTSDHPATNASYGAKAGMDLVSGVVVGTAVGYGLDQWAQTLPLFMLICMALGTAAGVKLMLETSRQISQALEEEQKEKERGGRQS